MDNIFLERKGERKLVYDLGDQKVIGLVKNKDPLPSLLSKNQVDRF